MRGNHFPFLKYFLFAVFSFFADNFDFLFTYEVLKLKPAPFIRKKSEVLKIARSTSEVLRFRKIRDKNCNAG